MRPEIKELKNAGIDFYTTSDTYPTNKKRRNQRRIRINLYRNSNEAQEILAKFGYTLDRQDGELYRFVKWVPMIHEQKKD